jgi:Lon protease-like protein
MAVPDSEFPDQTGLMILPWVSLFPGALMPLKIFEPRYQEMLSRTLTGNRIFAIAHTTGEESDCEPLGSMGLIRACVRNDDGTSNLVLQGVSRVKFEGIIPEPYPHSKIAVLIDSNATSPEMGLLRMKIAESFKSQSVEKLEIPEAYLKHLDTLANHGAFTDMIASTAIEDPEIRRLILKELDITARMELLLGFLEVSEEA